VRARALCDAAVSSYAAERWRSRAGEVRAESASAADEGLFVGQPHPLAGEDAAPDVIRIPDQPFAIVLEEPRSVMDHLTPSQLTQRLGRDHQPLSHGGIAGRVGRQLLREVFVQVQDMRPVVRFASNTGKLVRLGVARV